MRDAESDAPDASLTLSLVASRAFPRDFLDDADADAVAEAVAALECVRLDGCRLANLGGPRAALPSAGAPGTSPAFTCSAIASSPPAGLRGGTLPSLRFLALRENRLASPSPASPHSPRSCSSTSGRTRRSLGSRRS